MQYGDFNHQKSEFTDVFSKPDGSESVQIWNKPFRAEESRFLFTYRRTPSGPVDVKHRVYLDEGPYELIETWNETRTFYYRDGKGRRFEFFLPSGRRLIEDSTQGTSLKTLYTADFDFDKQMPKGKPLGDRPIMRLQTEGKQWFLSVYLQTSDGSSTLRLVTEYEGHTPKQVYEFNSE